jgi:hypothetical protein
MKNISKSNQSLKVMCPIYRAVPDRQKVPRMLSRLFFHDGTIVRNSTLVAAEKPLPSVLHCLTFLQLKIWKLHTRHQTLNGKILFLKQNLLATYTGKY